jgi:hypothetical protein
MQTGRTSVCRSHERSHDVSIRIATVGGGGARGAPPGAKASMNDHAAPAARAGMREHGRVIAIGGLIGLIVLRRHGEQLAGSSCQEIDFVHCLLLRPRRRATAAMELNNGRASCFSET